MARIRTVKPELFLHEGLFDLEQATGLPIIRCWVALLTQADREGRFEWRPRPLKAQCAPYDNLDFRLILEALAGAGFIVRYQADGFDCAFIPTFLEHQCVNHREAPSKLPPPPENLPEHPDLPSLPPGEEDDRHDASRAVPGTPGHARGEWNGMEREWNGTGREGVGAPDGATDGEAQEDLDPADSGQPPEPPPPREPEPEPEPPRRSRKRAEDVPVPPELDTAEFRETWGSWIKSRRKRRWPIDPDFALEKLQVFTRYGPKASAAAMRDSIEQGWQGVFPENFDLITGAKRGKRNEPSRVGPGQRYAGPGTGSAHSGAATGGAGSQGEARAGAAAGTAGSVVNGRWKPG